MEKTQETLIFKVRNSERNVSISKMDDIGLNPIIRLTDFVCVISYGMHSDNDINALYFCKKSIYDDNNLELVRCFTKRNKQEFKDLITQLRKIFKAELLELDTSK